MESLHSNKTLRHFSSNNVRVLLGMVVQALSQALGRQRQMQMQEDLSVFQASLVDIKSSSQVYKETPCLKKRKEKAQWLRELAACSSEGPEFNSQHPHGSSQMSDSVFWCADVHADKRPTYIKYINRSNIRYSSFVPVSSEVLSHSDVFYKAMKKNHSNNQVDISSE